MKNLKRVLCLALSLVMLLGMMMIGANAVTFTDADQIVNTEAVEITSGLGLFAGTSDGKFDPKGTVTRAQMATIIVKMLRGSTFNADAFKGVNSFSDTAAFEGGWAEGYINACSQLGVVAGYGDGTYKPGKELTTAEAVTMIINALKVDAGRGEWPLTVMSKAEQMKLFSELKTKPNTNDALSRDDLAAIVLQGLKYSPSDKSGYEVTVNGKAMAFTDYAEALTAAASMGLDATAVRENVGEDTLANKTFEMKTATGIVVENKATGAEYTVLSTDATDYDVETGLDSIGHFVTIYYKDLAKETYKEVYCVIDDCTVAEVKDNIAANNKDYKAAFGKSTKLAQAVNVFNADYTINDATQTVADYQAGQSAPAGTYVIYENAVISYIAKAPVTASYVVDIDKDADRGQIWLSGVDQGLANVEGDDVVTEYPGIALKDYVTYTVANGQYVLKPVDPVSGIIAKSYHDAKEDVDVINIGGVDYPYFGGTNDTDLDTRIDDLDYEIRYTLYVTEDGKYVGYKKADSTANVADVAYVLGAFQLEQTDEFGAKTRSYYAQGVNTSGKEVRYLMGIEYDTDIDGVFGGANDDETVGVTTAELAEGWYNTKESTDREEKKVGIYTVEAIGKTYDADNNPLFWGANRWISTGDTTISYTSGMVYNTVHICSANCTATKHTGGSDATGYYSSNTKFLIIDGTLGGPLECSMIPKSSIKYTTSSANGDKQMGFNMLLSKDDSKNVQVELVVMKKTASQMSGGTNVVYVSEAALEPSGKSSKGVDYDVYVATTGKAVTLTVGDESAFPTAPGFYTYDTDADGLAEDIRLVTLDKTTYLYPDVKFNSLYNGTRISASKLAGSAAYQGVSADNASSAVIVDVRSEDEIDKSGVAAVTSLERINSLANTSHKFVTLSVGSKNASTAGAVFVTGVYTAPRVAETLYIESSPAANSVITARTLDGQYKKIFVSKASNLAGYVAYRLADNEEDAIIEEPTDIFNGPVTKAMLNGAVLTVNGEPCALDASTTIVDKTPNGIDTVEEFTTALNTDGVVSLSCNVVPQNGKVAEIIITGGEVDDGMVAENFGITGNGHILFIPGKLTSSGGEGDAYLCRSTSGSLETKKVHITWTAVSYPGTDRFYRTVNSGALYDSPLSAYSGYYAYKTGYHNTVVSLTKSGSTYTCVTENAHGHVDHGGSTYCDGQWEAPLNITFSTSTKVIDVRNGVLPGFAKVMSADDLMARVNNGEEIMISYYCHRNDVTNSAAQETDKVNKPETAVANVIFITD